MSVFMVGTGDLTTDRSLARTHSEPLGMDSEESRDGSSANESDRKGSESPLSARSGSRNSARSGSRNSGRSGSRNSRSGSRNTRSGSRNSPLSHSPSPDSSPAVSRSSTPKRSRSNSRPKSPDSACSRSSGAPQSPPNDEGPRSPSPVNSVTSSPGRRANAGKRARSSSSSSHSNKSVSPDRVSNLSRSSRGSRRSDRRRTDDGNSSDSSEASFDSSSRRNKNQASVNVDTQPEEISDGDMESDNEKDDDPKHNSDTEEKSKSKPAPPIPRKEISIAHEDLSDVSDLDESIGGGGGESDYEVAAREDDEDRYENNDKNDSRGKAMNGSAGKVEADRNNMDDDRNEESRVAATKPENVATKAQRAAGEDGEEQLDFEAEDGECCDAADENTRKKGKDDGRRDGNVSLAAVEGAGGGGRESGEVDTPDGVGEGDKAAKKKEKTPEELEEGEVSDEDEVRPEETEPRPVCRFFSRGQCTWGASCRFLHPGVTDKGNYTMFEIIRPVVPGEFGREERYPRTEPAPIESAWERGLRTAKEMLRKSIKRKEQDIDFEEKKMNLSLAQEEFDKENGYYGRVASPEPPRFVRHVPVDFPAVARPPPPPPEEYYPRRPVLYEPEYAAPRDREREQRDRVRSYRELPSHRMPDYYNNKYEEEPAQPAAKQARKPKREVIVQRAPEERPVRADEWSDPWMRSKSPAGRKGGATRKRSYSSGSSYSSSSSSRSSSDSSRSSRSRSRSHTKKTARPSHRTRQVSPSIIVSERKAANERAALMNPPAPRKRAPSPGMLRVPASNPPAPSKEDQFGRTRNKIAIAAALARVKGRRRSSKSSSESSGSSSSDSDSSGSSSSSSRDASSPRRSSGVNMSIAKAMDALKGGGGGAADKRPIKLNLKTPMGGAGGGSRKIDISELARKTEALQAAKKRAATSPPPLDPKSKKATSRREELLKQLKAVEDAIAKKRSKVN